MYGKSPQQWAPSPIVSPYQGRGKIWGSSRPVRNDHARCGSTPKLNFSAIVTPACAADTEAEVIAACGTPETFIVGHISLCCGQVLLQILVVLGSTHHVEVIAVGSWRTFGARNHALVEAELLLGDAEAAKEREHSVKLGPHFRNLVRLVHGLGCLIIQV